MRYLTISILLIYCSCQMVVEVELPEQTPQLVGNCLFTTDTIFITQVSASIGLLDKGEIKFINNATVRITDNSLASENLTFMAEGYYFSTSLHPKSGKTYNLKIDAPGYSSITATEMVPSVTPLQLATITDTVNNINGDEGQFAEVYFSFNDPAGSKNFYGITIWKQSADTFSYYPQKNAYWLESNDPSVETHYSSMAFFTDELFNGKSEAMKIYYSSYDSLMPGDTLFFDFQSLSEAYYLYIKTFYLNRETSFNPFAEPVQVYTNISGGLGIFAGKSRDRKVLKTNP